MHNFTTEELLQYLYHETSPSKTAEIKAALESDWSLREKFEVVTSAQKSLEPVALSPRQETIDAIMNYAENTVENLVTPV
jgi:hypothetical protein